jgi:hypothetical protein
MRVTRLVFLQSISSQEKYHDVHGRDPRGDVAFQWQEPAGDRRGCQPYPSLPATSVSSASADRGFVWSAGGLMGVLSRKVKSRGRAPTLLRGVFKSMTPPPTYVTAAPLESTNSKTASLLLEKCAQV